jgi:hypothetical protein
MSGINQLPDHASRRSWGRILLASGLVCLAGCGSWFPEMVPFGAVGPPDYNRSLNGLGVHRKMWELEGAKCLTPQKLSPKLETMDVIVLVGQSYDPPGQAARDWLEDWLANQPGRTVIYFGRDFNADIYFRQRTLSRLPPAEQPRGEQLLAMREVQELNRRLWQLPESTFCRWFYLDVDQSTVDHTSFSGEWAGDLPAVADSYWPVRVALQPPDQGDWRNQKPSWLTTKPANPLVAANPPTAAPSDTTDAVVQRSDWEPQELDTVEKWNDEIARAPKSEILLSGSDEQALVFRLTSERFDGSQILIVANGAPFLNGSQVDRIHQRVGEKIVESCLPAKRVALLAYGQGGLLITSAEEKDTRGAGLEMFIVWPLGAITIPAALLGIVVCAALWPVLGRPQGLARRSVSDFGLHVEAIGRMLYEARDIQHAKSVIEEYFRKVRKEPPPSWLLSLEVPALPKTGEAVGTPENSTPTSDSPPSTAQQAIQSAITPDSPSPTSLSSNSEDSNSSRP